MIFAFLVSFLSFAHIDVGGELYISELLFAAYLFFSVHKFHLLSEPLPRKILLLGVLWLLSQIETDLIRETPPERFLRGWAAIVFFLIDFCAVYIMVRKKSGIMLVLVLGSALGTIFSVFALPTEYSEMEPWKFGYGGPVTMLTLLYLSTGDRYKVKSNLLLLVILGILGVYWNARGLGGISLLVAFILYLSQKVGFKSYIQHYNPIKLLGVAVLVLFAAFVISSGYQLAAESGYLPERALAKYQMSKTKEGGLLGIILGGRFEILISPQAVIDSPIIGHGSWAEDTKYSNMRYDVVDKLGLDIDPSYLKYNVEFSDLIPAHSVIMQAWIWAGVLGAVFWLFILRFIIRATFVSFMSPNTLQPLVIFTGISGCWAVLFSPFGSSGRVSWSITLIILFVGIQVIESGKAGYENKLRCKVK